MWVGVEYAVLYVVVLAMVQVQWKYCVPVCVQVLKAAQALLVVGAVRLYAIRDDLGAYTVDIEPQITAIQKLLFNRTLLNE